MEIDGNDGVQSILREIRHLQALDLQSAQLSVSTNWTYWGLGKAYQAFIQVSPFLSCRSSSTEAEQAQPLGA